MGPMHQRVEGKLQRKWAVGWLLLPSLLALDCGKGKPAAPAGLELQPLPAAPALQVSPEALPGANGTLAVVGARPRALAGTDVHPSLTFSRPIMPLSTIEAQSSMPPPAQLEPRVAGEWRWLGSASVEFIPAAPLPFSTRYTVTVPAGLKSVDGASLAEAYAWTFQTPAPALQSVDPPEDWKWVAAEQHFFLVFNQPVAELETALHIVAGVPATVWPFTVAKVEKLDDGEQHPGHRRSLVPSRQTRYEVVLGKRVPGSSPITFSLDGSLRGTEGPLTLGTERRLSFRRAGPMAVDGAVGCDPQARRCPYGPLLLLTSNPAVLASLREKLTLSPAVALDWESAEVTPGGAGATGPAAAISGRFRPGTTYTATVAAGLRDEFGQTAPAASYEFRTSDLEPSFDPGPDVALLEAKGDGALPVEVTNLASLEARVWTLSPAEMARFLGARHPQKAKLPGTPVVSTLDTAGSHNLLQTRPLRVRDMLSSKGATLFFAELSAPELAEQWRRVRRVSGQITDLVVHAKLGATSSAVWVTRLSDGKPVQGADLQLFDRLGAVRWRGKSDADGLARLPGLAEVFPAADGTDAWEPPFALVAASLAGDTGVTLSDWMGGFGPWAFDLPTDWDGRTPKSLGVVFADRGIYRPGDTVFLKGLARYRALGKILTAAKGTPVQLRVLTSRGKEVASQTLALDEFGAFSSEVVLDRDVPLGTFQVKASVLVNKTSIQYGGSFRVEEYRAPQFKLDVTSASPDIAAGDAVAGQVLARYLFGGAMAGSDVRWTVTRTSLVFEPPGNEGFSFGQVAAWDEEAPPAVSDVFASGEGKTDGMGVLAIEAGKAEAPANRTYLYTLEAEVTDVSRQRQANRAALTVHPAALYAGVRTRGTGFAEAGKPVALELVAVTPQGARQAGVDVEVSIIRRDWKFIRKKGVGERWTTVTEPVEEAAGECKLKTQVTPVSCGFTPKDGGFYLAKAVVHDASGRAQATSAGFYVLGSGWVSWQRNDTDRIDLVADKTLYDVGETARVLVKSPFPDAEALLTVEREGVLTARRVKLSGAATALDIPLGEDDIPNVFVSVVLVRGRVQEPAGADLRDDPGRPTVRVGYAQLRVERKSKRLTVELGPDAKEKRPRDKVNVSIHVTDWKAQGVPAEVTVWAVDEGVLRLTGYEVPDPVEAVHPLRGLSVRLGEPLIHLVQRKLYGEKGLSLGGGGGGDGSGSGFRNEFKTTVLFAPAVLTDGDGRAHVEFTLPDNLTTYRLMAVAITRGDKLGSGQSQVTVSKPLLAMPALPRLVRVGDRLEAGVVVHSPGGKVKEVEVKAEVQGLILDGPALQRVSLPDGRPREVRFRYRATAPGEAVFRFAVSGGGERDGLEQRIPVQLPTSLEAVALSGDTTDVRREALIGPAGMRQDVGGLEVTLASTALGGFGEAMRQLVDYPYGCLEQLSSRLVPFVALRELSSRFGVPWKPDSAEHWVGSGALAAQGARDPDALIVRTVKAIEQLQGPDGGYHYWSTDGCSSEWASPYAVLALGRSAEVGYPVDAAALKRGQEFLARVVASGEGVRCRAWWVPRLDDTTRVFAVWALARTGAPKASYYGELFARREALPLFARAMLADAMFVGRGDRAQARTLLSEVMDRAKESTAGLHFEEMDANTYASRWSSDVRTTALVLLTLSDVTPDHPYVAKLARYLTGIRASDGRYRTTQEAAFALMALTEVTRVKEHDTPDFVGRMTLDGKELASAPFRGRSLDIQRATVPLQQLPRTTHPLALDFRRDGKAGVLYYGALLRYAPAQMPTTAMDRGIVVQRWVEPYSGGGQVKAVQAGELVRIQVRLATSMERSNVAVDVPLPAGLEAVDTSLSTTARLSPAAGSASRVPRAEDGDDDEEGEDSEGEESAASAWTYGFWSPFNHIERRDDRVVLFADTLSPGIHIATIIARATTPGDFLLMPAHAEEMYAPEVFGRSDGGEFRVVEGNTLAEK